MSGENLLIRDRVKTRLRSTATTVVEPGERLIVSTPGSGGWGVPRAND